MTARRELPSVRAFMSAKRKLSAERHPHVAPLDRAIGARIRMFRQARKLSQTELGKHLNVTFQQVQKYELGINRVSSASLITLCSALGVKPEQLLGNGHGVFHEEPDVLEALQDKQISHMLVELHRLPKSQRVGLLQIMQTIVKTFGRV